MGCRNAWAGRAVQEIHQNWLLVVRFMAGLLSRTTKIILKVKLGRFGRFNSSQ
jgi:hypothetical protein